MSETTRREFLTAGAVGAAAIVAPSGVYAAADDTLKIGVIGCGGRGTGATINSLDGNKDIKITAIADVFDSSIKSFIREVSKKNASRLAVTPETTFVGLDAYQKVIDSGVDLVILATPPGFRPTHLEAAVKAGKHVFCEKPVAVDPAGIRKCLAVADEAKKKNLAIVAGTQRRHQRGYLDSIAKLKNDNAIGDILGGRVYWNNSGSIWFRPRHDGMSDTAYQLHNWYHFAWLCGDHIVEQHVHNLDVANWVMGANPLRCIGMGGRVRPYNNANVDGHIFDHFAVEYEYPNGVIVQSYCRQIDGCNPGDISESFIGTKGKCKFEDGNWEINGQSSGRDSGPDRYVQEHIDLINSIRAGKPLNELAQVTNSTLTAIMGRMSTYTGRPVTWDQALNSKLNLMPADLKFDGKLEAYTLPIPGKTKLI